MKRIQFKSTPDNYFKERIGLKCNTVRKFDGSIRFEILDTFPCDLEVEIINTKTNESFIREVKDVTKFEGYYIISW
jgi:hypothetical protein